jgi:hypothetical protein
MEKWKEQNITLLHIKTAFLHGMARKMENVPFTRTIGDL